MTLDSTQDRRAKDKGPVRGIMLIPWHRCAHACDGDFLTCGYIGRAAYDLERFRTDVDRTHGQLVGIRVFGSLKNMADHDAVVLLPGTFDVLYLQAAHGQLLPQGLGRKAELHVLLQPMVRDAHKSELS
jgi:hypothetical protein